jgi:hypothetical protein
VQESVLVVTEFFAEVTEAYEERETCYVSGQEEVLMWVDRVFLILLATSSDSIKSLVPIFFSSSL